jgi:hypothetical protein
MKLSHLLEISGRPGRKPRKITGYIFAWGFSLVFWATLLLVAIDRLHPFAGLPWPT